MTTHKLLLPKKKRSFTHNHQKSTTKEGQERDQYEQEGEEIKGQWRGERDRQKISKSFSTFICTMSHKSLSPSLSMSNYLQEALLLDILHRQGAGAKGLFVF